MPQHHPHPPLSISTSHILYFFISRKSFSLQIISLLFQSFEFSFPCPKENTFGCKIERCEESYADDFAHCDVDDLKLVMYLLEQVELMWRTPAVLILQRVKN
jgi:hypothetical protein